MARGGTGRPSLKALIDAAPRFYSRPTACWVCLTLTDADRALVDDALRTRRLSQLQLSELLKEAGYAEATPGRVQRHWVQHVKAR